MRGRDTFTRDEVERARLVIGSQLEAYRELSRAVRGAGSGDAAPALAEFEHVFFNSLALALDRAFARHSGQRTRGGPALDELAVIVDSLLHDDGAFRSDSARYDPAASVVGLTEGEHVRLTADRFQRLYDAVVAEVEATLAE